MKSAQPAELYSRTTIISFDATVAHVPCLTAKEQYLKEWRHESNTTSMINVSHKWLVFIALLLLFDAIADIFLEEWRLKGSFSRAALSWVFYSAGAASWLFAFNRGAELGRGALVYSVSVALVGVAIGLYYGETMTTTRIIGGCLGLAAVWLLAK
jgi:drug/metabolite transporter (DMT)-like permease